MDNNILNNLTLYKGKWFSDLIDTNKISLASQQKPYEVATVLSYVFGTKDNGYSTSIDMLTGGLGNVMIQLTSESSGRRTQLFPNRFYATLCLRGRFTP